LVPLFVTAEDGRGCQLRVGARVATGTRHRKAAVRESFGGLRLSQPQQLRHRRVDVIPTVAVRVGRQMPKDSGTEGS